VSPLGFPINPETKYAGIEKLVLYYANELNRLGHDVTVMSHADSVFPEGIKTLPYKPDGSPLDEAIHFQIYQSHLRTFDVIHDFSHLHLIARFMASMPTLNIFWHPPALAQYAKAPYNIIALSKWAQREFERIYHQKSRYQYSIPIDTKIYKRSNRHRNNRFYALGRMGVEKGNLEAALLCIKAGVPLDIQASQETQFPDYTKQVLSLCDGKQLKYLGDLSELEKIKIMQTNKALIYATTHPEVTSHKLQECLLTGMPAIISDIGAAHEILTDKVNGFLCRREDEFIEAIKHIDDLNPDKVYEEVKHRFCIETVIGDYIKLYEEVANGARW